MSFVLLRIAHLFPLQDGLQDRQHIGCCLARARFGLGQHILAFEGQRDGLALNESRITKLVLGNCLHDARVEAEFRERQLCVFLFACNRRESLLSLPSPLGLRNSSLGRLVVLVEFPFHLVPLFGIS